MKSIHAKRFLTLSLALALVLLAALLGGCSQDTATPDTHTNRAKAIKIGTLQTDDLLPLWVGQEKGYLKEAGLDVEIIVFQSAQEQIAAITAGEVDGIMTDMVVSTQLSASGTPMRAVTVMQGAPAGILSSKDSGITSLKQLAGVPIGCSSPTILEYIVGRALADNDVAAGDIKIEEIKKLPVRFEMLTSNQIKAAALPWTFFQLGKASGATPLLDEAQASAYTSTVLDFSQKYLDTEGAPQAIEALLGSWDKAVDDINADPNSYRDLFVDKASLPDALRSVYQVRQYPKSALPQAEQLESVITWMVDKGYLKEPLAVDGLIFVK